MRYIVLVVLAASALLVACAGAKEKAEEFAAAAHERAVVMAEEAGEVWADLSTDARTAYIAEAAKALAEEGYGESWLGRNWWIIMGILGVVAPRTRDVLMAFFNPNVPVKEKFQAVVALTPYAHTPPTVKRIREVKDAAREAAVAA